MVIQLDEARLKLNSMLADVDELASALKIEKLKESIPVLEEKTTDPNFWSDPEKSTSVLQELKRAKDKVEFIEKLKSRVEDDIALCEMGIEADDDGDLEEIQNDVKDIEKTIENMRIEALLSGPYDKNNVIISIHPGAGGTEAQDWAEMLYRMYMRWAERHGYKTTLVDWLDGDEAGIKSATFTVEGINAYGYLKSENGVHRLVRISPFDASGRRHTSFASVEVTPEIDDDKSIEIKEEDIEVTAHRSSGAGGQHINKTDSAIRIVHKPTGIVVGCQTERSQLQNKETAMKMLRSKLAEKKREEDMAKLEGIRGEKTNIEWGSQIRSYVFMPYTLAKDARTGYEDGDISAVMDGDIDGFINAYLKYIS